MINQTEVKNAENVRKRHFFCEQKNVLSVYRSDYRKSLPGEFIRIRLKIEQNYRLFLDIFSSAINNDLFMTFISRLKVDANVFISNEIGSQWRTILGHPQLI